MCPWGTHEAAAISRYSGLRGGLPGCTEGAKHKAVVVQSLKGRPIHIAPILPAWPSNPLVTATQEPWVHVAAERSTCGGFFSTPPSQPTMHESFSRAR